MGESGVGKSTLLNCMAGLDSWNEGSVVLDGLDLSALSNDQLARLRREKTGFVFQVFHVLPHLSVAQNVALPLMLLSQHDDARVQAMLDEVGLTGLGERLPQQLSGGQLQRVAIARALIHRPMLLLAPRPPPVSLRDPLPPAQPQVRPPPHSAPAQTRRLLPKPWTESVTRASPA